LGRGGDRRDRAGKEEEGRGGEGREGRAPLIMVGRKLGSYCLRVSHADTHTQKKLTGENNALLDNDEYNTLIVLQILCL